MVHLSFSRRRLLSALGAWGFPLACQCVGADPSPARPSAPSYAASAASTASSPAPSAATAPPAAAPSPTLLVLGDSLAAGYGLREEEGWVALLAERMKQCAPQWQVVNASISGETTSGGRQRLPALLARHQPQVVVLELGANDGLRGLSLAVMREHLTAMVRAAHTAGAKVVLIGMRIPPNLGPDYTETFAITFARVAEAERVAGFVPFLLAPIALEPSAFQPDGLHPTATVQPLLLETVWPAVAPLVGCRPSDAVRSAVSP